MAKCSKIVNKELAMYEKFLKIINNNNGVITTKEAEKKGILRVFLKKMTDEGIIKRIAHGIYATDKFMYDDYYIFELKHSNIIFSHNTALYLHNMTERTPNKMDITTKRNKNLSSYKDTINLFRINDNILELGKCKVKTIYGNTVTTYNLERTVCDMIRIKSTTDIELTNKSIRKCIKNKNFDANKMFIYAKKMKIFDKVKNYIEAVI